MHSTRKRIESLRPSRSPVSPWAIPKFLVAEEPDGLGAMVETTTLFLIGAECPFRCSMCDLWQHTTVEPTPPGAIPHQMDLALESIARTARPESRRWLKLYNASNFFDDRSIPIQDWERIAQRCRGFERIVVENHPNLCDRSIQEFANMLDGRLEVAMGLESIHPEAIARMNKSMSLSDFDRAVDLCRAFDVDVRVFVLLHPPGIDPQESVDWTWKTVRYALDRLVRHASVIPVRPGNGWIDQQIADGSYELPSFSMVLDFFDCLTALPSRTVLEFDLWDWGKIGGACNACREGMRSRIACFNETQRIAPWAGNARGCECCL